MNNTTKTNEGNEDSYKVNNENIEKLIHFTNMCDKKKNNTSTTTSIIK